MSDLAKNLILIGFGLASMTEEKVKEVYKKLLDHGEGAVKDSKYFKELIEALDKNADEVEKKFEEFLGVILNKMNLVRKEELEKLEKRVSVLEEKLKELQEKSATS